MKGSSGCGGWLVIGLALLVGLSAFPDSSYGASRNIVRWLNQLERRVTDLEAQSAANMAELRAQIVALKDELAAERAARETGDGSLRSDLISEQDARVARDSDLQGQISTLSGRMGLLESSLTAERAARINADNGLQAQVNNSLTQDSLCSAYRDADGIAPPFCPRTIFLSSQRYRGGDLGGLAGADAKCQALAENAGLPGAYMAWLSDETHYAPDRVPTHAPVSYSNRCDSGMNLVASNFDDLASGNHQNPISCDETGVDHIGDLSKTTWTGEFESIYGREACLGWTAADPPNKGGVGLFDRYLYNPPIEFWISRDSDHCMTLHRLYCVEK